jgi:chaperone protein EcpD
MLARLLRCAALAPAILAGAAQAGVVIDATRVIYPAARREVSVNLRNPGEAPALIQAWIDTGEATARPGAAKSPFVLTPPLFRVDPAKGQTLRLIYSGEALPADRESLFWLNVLDIPPRTPADPAAPNRLEMAFRHRMKVFFRPANLPGKASDAARAVVWSVVRQDGQAALEARNPTPYHISFASAEVGSTAVPADMLAPFATRRFALPPSFRAAGPATVKYGFVDDFGAVLSGTASAETAD